MATLLEKMKNVNYWISIMEYQLFKKQKLNVIRRDIINVMMQFHVNKDILWLGMFVQNAHITIVKIKTLLLNVQIVTYTLKVLVKTCLVQHLYSLVWKKRFTFKLTVFINIKKYTKQSQLMKHILNCSFSRQCMKDTCVKMDFTRILNVQKSNALFLIFCFDFFSFIVDRKSIIKLKKEYHSQKELIILVMIYYEDYVAIKATLIFLILYFYNKLAIENKPYLTGDLNNIDYLSTSICQLSIILKGNKFCQRLFQNTTERKQLIRKRFQLLRCYLIQQAKMILYFKEQNNIELPSSAKSQKQTLQIVSNPLSTSNRFNAPFLKGGTSIQTLRHTKYFQAQFTLEK